MLLSHILVLLACTPEEPIPVLIVDGQNNHDWKATSSSMKASLLKSGIFSVDVSTSPARKSPREAWDRWRPEFSKYKAVVLDYNGEEWPSEVKDAFVQYVQGGGGVVSIHAANNSFSNWGDYNRMIGLGWWDAKTRDRVTINDATGEQIRTPKSQGPGPGHGAAHAFVVTVRQLDHPIMKGIPAKWMHGIDELYHGQRGPAEDMTVLASALSDKTNEHEPMVWLISFGKGKVVTCVMGHHGANQKDFSALHCVGFQTILIRSCEWVASGRVTYPVPPNFPTVEKPSVVNPNE